MDPSWRVLGTSWGVLGEFVSSWGRLGGVLGAFWRIPALSWDRLGAVLGAVWAVLGRRGVALERLRGLLGHLGGDFTGIKQFFRGMTS